MLQLSLKPSSRVVHVIFTFGWNEKKFISCSIYKAAKISIHEGDIVEKLSKGGGPGGQKVNKSVNKVQITHIPTGISVYCQEARDLTSNRKIARKLLAEKLDFIENGSDSKIGKKIEKIKRRKRASSRRAKKKYGSPPSISSPEEVEDIDEPTSEVDNDD